MSRTRADTSQKADTRAPSGPSFPESCPPPGPVRPTGPQKLSKEGALAMLKRQRNSGEYREIAISGLM